jgi:RHS repeat-associated protein
MLPRLFAMIDMRKTLAFLLLLVAALLCTGPGNTARAQALSGTVSPMALPPPPIEPDMPVNGAQTVSQSAAGTMYPNGLYNVSVTMKNTGNTDWTQSGKYALVSFNPVLNMTWGVNRIALPTSTVLSGATVSFNFQVRAPATPGSYAFQWILMQEGVGSFGALSSMTVTVRERINNAMPSVLSVPTQMQTGQRYDVSLTMVNNGETTWTRAQQYTLMSQSPYNNTTWGFNRVPLPVDNIAPGQSATFNFQVTAPGTPGSYAFQWGMQREAYGAFGASAAAVSVKVAGPPPLVNDAQVVGMSAPPRMVTGQGYQVAVTMKNTGTTTWTPGENYKLGSQNPQDNQIWGLSRVAVATPVAPGQQYTFDFPVTAPAADSYAMQWRMLRELVEWFGARASSPVTVTENLGKVTFIHTDGLGSPVARTDGAGNVISRTRYEPYGHVASGAAPTIGFTGHVNDADTGLTYMQQRYFDPVAGRFLSIDPVVTDTNTGGSFNRYFYAQNNPYKFVDPDGRDVVVVVNRNDPVIGTHVGFLVGRGEGAVLYDPGGSYKQARKGSGDALYGRDANLSAYVKYQKRDGPDVEMYTVATSETEDGEIKARIESYGGGTPGMCAIDSANVLRGVGPFKELGRVLTPAGMARAMQAPTFRRYIPGQGNANDPETKKKEPPPPPPIYVPRAGRE